MSALRLLSHPLSPCPTIMAWYKQTLHTHPILNPTPPLRVRRPRHVVGLLLDHPTRGKRRSCPFRAKLCFDFVPTPPENTLHRRCSRCGTRRGAITGGVDVSGRHPFLEPSRSEQIYKCMSTGYALISRLAGTHSSTTNSMRRTCRRRPCI